MSGNVDLSQLAIDRTSPDSGRLRTRRHVLTRYVLPATLLLGFCALVLWAAWDFLFPPREVRVVPVLATHSAIQQEGTPLFNAAGWVEPRPTPIRVAALAPGVIQELLVVEDQPLEAGQPVAELVKDDARLVIEEAKAAHKLRMAELDDANAQLAAARTRFTQPVHLQAALSEAEANRARVQTELTNLPFERRRADARHVLAQKDYDRKSGADEGVVRSFDIDRARSELATAEALVEELRDRESTLTSQLSALTQRRDALRKQLELLADERQALDQAKAQLAAAQARVEQAKVAVETARLQLDRMTIRAPVDGRVFELVSTPGARLSGGMGDNSTYDSSTVITMYRPSMLQVRADVRFEDLPRVSDGQPVLIENPALDAPLRGKVLLVSSLADIQKNTLEVKVAIDDPPGVFKPEMLVDVTFLAPAQASQPAAAHQELRLLVPESLIRRDGDAAFVWVADQSDGIARRATVQLGAQAAGGLREITSGLDPGSRLIASDTAELVPGQRIRVVGEMDGLAVSSANLGGRSEGRPLNRLPSGGTD